MPETFKITLSRSMNLSSPRARAWTIWKKNLMWPLCIRGEKNHLKKDWFWFLRWNPEFPKRPKTGISWRIPIIKFPFLYDYWPLFLHQNTERQCFVCIKFCENKLHDFCTINWSFTIGRKYRKRQKLQLLLFFCQSSNYHFFVGSFLRWNFACDTVENLFTN